MRVALYARFSSDLQNERSAEDQVAALRQACVTRGWAVAGVYLDKGISGASLVNRPGVQTLMTDARSGRFDLVFAEDLDRLSRDQEGTAHLYKRLDHHGVGIETLSQGRIGVMHVGLAGTMNQLFLEQLAAKTRRGLIARVNAGFSGGGRCYGYRIVAKGLFEIDPVESAVVRRIFDAYAGGDSGRQIAIALNADGVPGLRGGEWSPSAVIGDRRAGDGILCQELYIGVRVFNRRRYRKDPETGRRSSVLNPPEQWLRQPVPDLRIIPDELWARVQARQEALSALPKTAARRPRRLLSGLLRCTCCSGPMTLNGPRYECARRRERGSCDNRRCIAAAAIEKRVIEGVKAHLLAPEAVASAVREWRADMEAERRRVLIDRAPLERELAGVQRRLDRAVAAMLDGVLDAEDLKRQVEPLKARKTEIEDQLANAASPAEPVQLHPGAAEAYRAIAEGLHEALNAEDGQETRDAFRALIERVDFTPLEGHGRYGLTVHGSLARLLGQNAKNPTAGNCGVSLGAGAGFRRNPTIRFAA